MARGKTDANVILGADISQFSTQMQNMSRQMAKVGREMQTMGATLTRNLTVPIGLLGAAALKSFMDIDALKRGLTTFSGSAAAAEEEFSKLREVAKLPGIGLEEAVRGSINLQAIGQSADWARRAMTEFGNAIGLVGGGRQNFDLAVRGFAQLSNATKPLQQDLYQISNQLPQVNKIMLETFGTARADDLAAMGLKGKELAEILLTGLSKLPRVTGGLKNSFENFLDTIKISLADLGGQLEKSLDVSGMLDGIAKRVQSLIGWFEGLSDTSKKLLLFVTGLSVAVGPLLWGLGKIAMILPTIITMFRTLAMSNPFLLAITGIGVLISALGVFHTANKERLTDEQQQIAAAKALFVQLGNTNTGHKKRSELITEINSKYGTTLTNMSDEKKFADQIATAYAGVVEQLRIKISMQANNDALVKSVKEELSLVEALEKGSIRLNELKNNTNEGETIGDVNLAKEINEQLQKNYETQNKIWEVQKKQRDLVEKGAKLLTNDTKKTIQNKVPVEVELEPTLKSKGSDILEQFIRGDLKSNIQKSVQEHAEEMFAKDPIEIDIPIKPVLDEAAMKWQEEIEAFASMLRDSAINTIYNIADLLGQAAAGVNTDDFGKEMLAGIGGFMQKLGGMLISLGIASKAFQDLLASSFASPPAAIAAIAVGAGLVAAGAAFKSAAKAGPNGSGGSGGGGNSYSPSSYSQDQTLNIKLTGEISGHDIVLSSLRYEKVGRR